VSGRPESGPRSGEVRSLLAPTAQGNLLLPAAAVAEVVAYSGDVRSRDGGPPWFAGVLDWRGQRPPLILLGMVGEQGVSDSVRRWRRPCVLVAFSPNGNPDLPYMGFLVADSPRLLRLRPGDLTASAAVERPPLVLCAVELQERSAWIPDLDEAERQLVALNPRG